MNHLGYLGKALDKTMSQFQYTKDGQVKTRTPDSTGLLDLSDDFPAPPPINYLQSGTSLYSGSSSSASGTVKLSGVEDSFHNIRDGIVIELNEYSTTTHVGLIITGADVHVKTTDTATFAPQGKITITKDQLLAGSQLKFNTPNGTSINWMKVSNGSSYEKKNATDVHFYVTPNNDGTLSIDEIIKAANTVNFTIKGITVL
ncbi:hypothetical protein [Lactobacillus terrae]|uniref:hypothetical protein n=1 Tax=Lactobacillus terrae TaxID=2269374 RepID=UPI000C1B71E7|nr:hypothetical protein [Lactobacillus terrae]